MRTVTDGAGNDSTAAVIAWLAANNQFHLTTLYLIGELEDPKALWLTDWEAPLAWPVWGTFLPSVIKRGQVPTKIGLEVATLDVEWTPPSAAAGVTIATANAYQLAQLGYFDNMKFRAWTVFMPTKGDANTYGACELFGGRIGDTKVERGKIVWTVNCFLDVVNQNVPSNVIELTNTLASYAGASPPAGLTVIPQFDVIAGSTTTKLIGDCTSPTPGQIFPAPPNAGNLQLGFVVFNSGVGTTLDRRWSGILTNKQVTIGPNNYNEIILFTPLPWAPTPGVDSFYVSATVENSDNPDYGFRYVPSPESAL